MSAIYQHIKHRTNTILDWSRMRLLNFLIDGNKVSLCIKNATDFCKTNVIVHDICTAYLCMALLHRSSNGGTSA